MTVLFVELIITPLTQFCVFYLDSNVLHLSKRSIYLLIIIIGIKCTYLEKLKFNTS